MTAIKKTAARFYLACMAEADAREKQAQATARREAPQRLIGGCVLYHLPLARKQQHPPTPYYS
ncbi:MAG: hypothetical protein JSR53_05645 [Proteobacteria bacterium]|nr:hypothetical protein [Pseudomonadota bacterium]MBS0506850.1 hypothetical protein [Pseudomonadota bacterium]